MSAANLAAKNSSKKQAKPVPAKAKKTAVKGPKATKALKKAKAPQTAPIEVDVPTLGDTVGSLSPIARNQSGRQIVRPQRYKQ